MGNHGLAAAGAAVLLLSSAVLLSLSCSSSKASVVDDLGVRDAMVPAMQPPGRDTGPTASRPEPAMEAMAPDNDAADTSLSDVATLDVSDVAVTSCDGSLTLCGSRCIDVKTDPSNCGACGHSCGGTGSTCTSGTCVCAGVFTLCNEKNQNQCVDLSSDPSNCGQCSYNCQGGGCAKSACLPTTIVQGSSGAGCFGGDIAVDMTNIYWTNGLSLVPNRPPGAVYFKAFSSSMGASAISSNDDVPSGLAFGANAIYWVDFNSGAVKTSQIVNANFHVPQFLQPDAPAGGPLDIVVDGNNIYWVNRVLQTVNQLPLTAAPVAENAEAGARALVLASSRNQPTAIAVDAHNVYWVDFGSALDPTGTVNEVPIGGNDSQVVQLAAGQRQPNDIVVDHTGTYVYWVNQAQSPNGAVMRVATTGKGVPTVLVTGLGGPTGIAIDHDDSYVYWTNYNDGTVQKVPTGGPDAGTLFTLANMQDTPQSITVDQVSVYWASHGTGNILKVAKGYY